MKFVCYSLDKQQKKAAKTYKSTLKKLGKDTDSLKREIKLGKSIVGKLTGALPWVSDNSSLTPAAFAYAQTVIGSSECMREAYDTTTQAMIEAYERQMESAGLDPEALEVEIVGEPDFGDLPDAGDLGDFEFETSADGASCSVADDAFEGDEIIPDPR